MPTQRTVSVVIVTHNRTPQLQACLESLFANTTPPKEIVVVDDGDTETTQKLLSQPPQSWPNAIPIKNNKIEAQGVSHSRNVGINCSEGEIVAFLDDDCIADPDWIQSMVDSHHRFSDTAAITGYIYPSFPQNYWNQVLFRFHLDKVQQAHPTTFLFGANYSFKREVFTQDQIMFNEAMPICSEDRYISHALTQAGRKMMYDPSIAVAHDFRTSWKTVRSQWQRYGQSDFHFWRVVPSYQSADATFFRKQHTLLKTLILPLRGVLQTIRFLHLMEISIADLKLIPGLFALYYSYYQGIAQEWRTTS